MIPLPTLSNRRNLRRIAFLITLFAVLLTYILTLDPEASLWDCPEYLVTAARLEIGHPPGNPFWMLTARIFSLFGGSDAAAVAVAVNLSSAIFSALAGALLSSILFIGLTLLSPGRRMRPAALIASIAGGTLFGWLDSTWFSAVEAEVYAMSLFLTALSMRLMLGVILTPSPLKRARMILLIIYLTGLSIGVHQLNLLAIPPLTLLWLFGRYRRHRRPGALRISLTLLLSFAAVGAILLGMMPGVIRLAALCELLCVNTLRLPFHSGVILCWSALMIVAWGLPIFLQSGSRISRGALLLLWMPAMLLTGYSSYMLILIRSAANPPMNEGAPRNIFSLTSYLNRDQYGSTPLIYGRTPYSRPMRREAVTADSVYSYPGFARQEGRPLYAPLPGDSGYRLYSRQSRLIYTPELDMWFPRLTSSDPADIACYADWAGMRPETMIPREISYALDSLDNPVGKFDPLSGRRFREKEMRPSYLQNLRYLFAYQIGYMYMRYLMWNFSGRQNDRFATGEVEQGNFITGIPPLDDLMLGPVSALPDEIGSNNPGHNRYFLLPLLCGIIGIIWLQHRRQWGRRANAVILLLFLMTGIAIVLYLNQSPREPRERDYSFLGSFWAYSLWIGCGLFALMRGALMIRLPKKSPARFSSAPLRIFKKGAILLSFLLSCALPLWVMAQNFDDHDRSGRRSAGDFATNLLESLEPDAILFTNGDNFTFPLWWAQEVIGVRRDVTVINMAYLATPWYVTQLMTPGPSGSRLILQVSEDAIRYGGFEATPYLRSPLTPGRIDSLMAVDAVAMLRRLYASGGKGFTIPAMLRIPNPEAISSDASESRTDSIILRSQAVASASSVMNFKRLILLDIIASNASSSTPRPLYWLSALPASDFAGTYPLTTRTLLTRRLVYADSLSDERFNLLLDRDLKKGNALLPGGKRSVIVGGRVKPGYYADASVGPMITAQRLGMLRLGGRLLKARRYHQAALLADSIMAKYPPQLWEFQIFNESDSSCYEGLDLARLYLTAAAGIESSEENADSAAAGVYRRKGLELLRRERKRLRQWHSYRLSLPPRYQNVLTPKHLQQSRLLNDYDWSDLKNERPDPLPPLKPEKTKD